MPRSSPPTRARFKYFETVPTRWNDNDPYGHVNNAIHYFIFDTVVNNYLIKNNLLDIGESEIIGLVAETGCKFFAPLKYPDPIDVGLTVTKIGTTSVVYEIGLFAPTSDVAAAAGHFVHIYVDEKTRKPAPLTDDMRRILDQIKSD